MGCNKYFGKKYISTYFVPILEISRNQYFLRNKTSRVNFKERKLECERDRERIRDASSEKLENLTLFTYSLPGINLTL